MLFIVVVLLFGIGISGVKFFDIFEVVVNIIELFEFIRDEMFDLVEIVVDIELDWVIKFGFFVIVLGLFGVIVVVERFFGKEISVWVKFWGIIVWGGDEFVLV